MVVLNGERDIRFPRTVMNMAIAAVLLTAVLSPVVYFALHGADGGAVLDAALYTIVGLVLAVIFFAGTTCIAHDRFRRMRRDRDYWTYLCNDYRKGRAGKHERIWHGLNVLHDLNAMDAVEDELPSALKRS